MLSALIEQIPNSAVRFDRHLSNLVHFFFLSHTSARSNISWHATGNATAISRNFHFELPLHPKSYASYPVAGELQIRPSKRAFWRNGSASLISQIAAIHSDRDARWRPGRRSLPLHRSCRGDREPFGWDRACSWNRTEVRNRRFPSCSAVGRGSIGR